MKHGKKICETLKGIRHEIAVANEIDYTPIKCDHKGDCAGTCPACESETRWLERQLRLRHALGKAVTIAGVSVALSVAASAAAPSSLEPGKKKTKRAPRPIKVEKRDRDDNIVIGKVPMPPQVINEGDSVVSDEIKGIEENIDGLVRIFVPHPDSIYTDVNIDIEAEFPGGDEALYQLIKERLVIPDSILAPIKEIGGRVKARCIVKALIETDGTVSDAVIEKSTSAALFDEEALRVVKGLPKFRPASIQRAIVRSWKLIPVEFVYDFSAVKEDE